MTGDVQIFPYLNFQALPQTAAALDAIFFEASNTKSFADDDARAAFRERWLGRYLAHDSRFAFLAVDSANTIAGYVIGAVDDPAHADRFADIPYVKAFGALSRQYPAHLHVNLAPAYRGRGIGERLVDRFAIEARRAGAPGVHVVTSRAARNVGFYNRIGFVEAAASGAGEREIVFLARSLG